MTKKISKTTATIFEQIKRIDVEGNEFWSARDLSKVLDYADYRNFKTVIAKAIESCKNSGIEPQNHIVEANDMVLVGSGVERQVDSFNLSRYACYLILQNADPAKTVVAEGQTYFAVQTRLQEIRQMDEYNALSTEDERRLFLRNELRRHNSQLAEAASDAGVITNMDYAIFQNHGYKGLYGGMDAKAIHTQKGLKKNQQILDHMGSTELAANLFRATQTEDKLRKDNIQGKKEANKTHFEIGKKVRKTIEEIGGTMPEQLPVAENITAIENKKNNKQQSLDL